MSLRKRMGDAARPLQLAEEEGREPSLEEKEAIGQLQLDLLEKYSPGVTEVLDENQLAALLGAWMEASEVSVGESVASASS